MPLIELFIINHAFHIGFAALVLYFVIGAILWSRFLYKWEAEEGLEDHLVRAERAGPLSSGEALALMVVKLAFYCLWPLFVALKLVCQMIGLLRFGHMRPAL